VIFITRALLHTDGFNGLRTGLELLGGLIERYWETLYPQLNPDDNNDPTERINILLALWEGEEIIDPLKRVTLCESRAMVHISLRDIRIATGKLTVSDKEKQSAPSISIIEAAFKDCDVKALQATKEVISQAAINLKYLDTLLIEKVGPKRAPDSRKLSEVLKEMDVFLETQLAGRVPSKQSKRKRKGVTQKTDDAGMIQPAKIVSIRTDKPMEMINNRKDVIRILDQICAYYDQNEPASPVPLLLKRARQLVEKNFFEIVQDLAPDSVAQIKKLISGVTDDPS
jgi:type VI secretion system protein ImpA